MMEAAIRKRLGFLDRVKISLIQTMISKPPYGHPVLNPLKDKKRNYYLPKNPEKSGAYIELN